MRKLHTNPFILSLAWLAAFSPVGCGGGGGGGGGGAPAGVEAPSDNNSDRLPQESDVSATGFRALAFTFSETPKQGQPVRIGITTSGTARDVSWRLVTTPAGAEAPLTADPDGLAVSLTADVPGRYELQVEANVDGEAAMGNTRFRVREEFAYNPKKVRRDSPDATLDTTVGPVTNQVFAFSIRSSEALLREILTFYPEFEVLGYDDTEGLLLQFDDQSPDAADVLDELRSEPEIDTVAHRLHEGENAPRILTPPNDGSAFNDGGDNWHLEKIGALEAWDENTGSVDFLVGVADSGFHPTHEDLLGRFASATLAPSLAKARHGMGVAGAIGARTNNVRGISGINRQSKIVATRYDMFGALDTVRNGRKVLLVNNSWAITGKYIPGNFQPNNPAHTEPRLTLAIERSRKYRTAAQRKYKDRLIVWAAGNGIGNGASTSDSDGDNVPDHYGVLAIYDNGSVHLNNRGSLSRLDNTVVVAALANDNRLVYYSEYGETVDIAAPTNFKSTSNVTASGSQYYVGASYGTNTGSGFGGTSAAAPVVTGAASLCFAADSKLTAKEVKKILIETATETATERYTTPTGKTERMGIALPILDMGAAVKAATPPEVEIAIDAGVIIENDQVFFDSEIETGLRPYIYEWDFGDGNTSSLPDDTHAYAKGGTYTVTLKVTDACDREATASLQLTVTDTGPDPETPPAREDWVVWYTGNVACWGAPLLYVSHRTGFERQELRSSFRGGGIDPTILVEKTVMQAGFDSREDAMAWICPQISGFYRHYWCGAHYLVGGEPFRFGNLSCDVSEVPEVALP